MGAAHISGSVGRNGVNRQADVRVIQTFLNRRLPVPFRPLAVTGVCGPETIAVIVEFQRRVVGLGFPDGRIDTGGRTLRTLTDPTTSIVTPAAKPFSVRVDEFREHARQQFGIEIGVNSGLRDAEWQQRMHIAHMIKFNSFAALAPKKSTTVLGRKLIDIDHLGDAKLDWGGSVPPEEFLRGADGKACVRKADRSGYEPRPDAAKTRARALEVLKVAGIATAEDRANEPHSAMVAPGLQGCAAPCACGGKRSNHLAGQAMDLQKAAILLLQAKLSPPTADQLNKLLSEFGLKRPMASEPHHVEPL